MDKNEVNEVIQSLETVSSCAVRISGETDKRQAATWHAVMASLAFARLAINSLNILKLTPGSSPWLHAGHAGDLKIWDLPSVSALSRNLIETYLTLHYFTRVELPIDELRFRKMVWRYHGVYERTKMLRSAVPHSTGLPKLEEERGRLKQELELNPLFVNLPKKKRQQVLHGEISKLETNDELCAYAGVSRGYYNTAFKYTSNHTHSSPFSFSEMDSFRANDASAGQKFNMATNISTAFIALGIRDYLRLCPDQLPTLSNEEKRLIAIWEGVLQWEASPYYEQRSLG